MSTEAEIKKRVPKCETEIDNTYIKVPYYGMRYTTKNTTDEIIQDITTLISSITDPYTIEVIEIGGNIYIGCYTFCKVSKKILHTKVFL